MNTTRIAVTMFGVAAGSLFLANFHLRSEFNSFTSDAPVLTTTLPTVTIVAHKPEVAVLASNNESFSGAGNYSQDGFNNEKGIIKFAYPASPDIDVFKKKGNIITFNTNPTTGLVFRIQMLASQTQVPLFSSRFAGIDNIKEEYDNGIYKYTVGDFSTPGRSLPVYLKLQDKGFRDVFLVAYKDDQRVPIKNAMREMMHYSQVSQ